MVGCGGIGTFAGAVVSHLPGAEVFFCARGPIEEIVVKTPSDEFAGHAEILTRPDQGVEVDLVILATKAQDTASAGPWLAALCGLRTPVLVLQNGVEHVERVHPLVPGRPIIPAIVWFGAQRTSPGHVQLTLAGDVTVPATKTGCRVAQLLDSPRLQFRASPAFQLELWTKFVHNVASNSLTTILDVPVNRLPFIPEARVLMELLIEECRAVARAMGTDLPDGLATAVAERFASFDDGVLSSTQVDRGAGRPMEYDAIVGAVVRLGARLGIRTDTARVLLLLLTAISQGMEQTCAVPDSEFSLAATRRAGARQSPSSPI